MRWTGEHPNSDPLHGWQDHIAFQINHLAPTKTFVRNCSMLLGFRVLQNHFKTCLLASLSFAIKCYFPHCSEHDGLMEVSRTHVDNITARAQAGDISSGEWERDERDNLLVEGSWPTVDNSSRLNRHTWLASQPSAGAMGVKCTDPHRSSPSPGPSLALDPVHLASIYAVIPELVPNYASHDVFTACNKAQPDSQFGRALMFELKQGYRGKRGVKDEGNRKDSRLLNVRSTVSHTAVLSDMVSACSFEGKWL